MVADDTDAGPADAAGEPDADAFGDAANGPSMDGVDVDPAVAGRAGRFLKWLARRARGAGAAVVSRALLLWYAALDPDTPARAKAVIIGALAYLVEPIDAIPDLTPLIGYTDDMTVLGLALVAVVAYVKPEHREAARQRTVEIFGEIDSLDEALGGAESA